METKDILALVALFLIFNQLLIAIKDIKKLSDKLETIEQILNQKLL